MILFLLIVGIIVNLVFGCDLCCFIVYVGLYFSIDKVLVV